LFTVVDDEDNVARRGAQLERYYQALFDLHWSNGTPRSVELLKEMLGTELLLPAPERTDEVVANQASQFFDQLEAMQRVFQDYCAREARETVAEEHVLDLLEEMGIDLGGSLQTHKDGMELRQRAVEVLSDGTWEDLEAWYQNPSEKAQRERVIAVAAAAAAAAVAAAAAAAAGAAETAASESAYAAGVQRGGVPQQITGGDAAILNEDEDEIMALEQAVSSSDGSRRDSIGSQLMQSFKEILAEPVAAQLVRGDAPLSAGGPPVEVDEDLCRYSRLSF
jgi:hypothetical protein